MNENNLQNNNLSVNNNPNSNPQPMNNTQPTPSVTSAPQPTPTVTSTPQPTPTVTSVPQPTPTVASTSQPTPTVASAPQPTPTVASTPQPAPTVASTPKPAPTVASVPQPTPTVASTQQAEPTPSTSQPSQPQELNLVNPLNPDEIVKKEVLVKKEVAEENKEKTENAKNNETNETSQQPKKKKFNPILLIALVAVIAILGVVLYFTFFNKSEPSTPNTPSTPETPATPQITLNDILNNFNNNENINQLRETSEVNANINNNVLTIDVTTDGTTTSYLFTLENRDLVYEINANDLTSNLLFLVICDNIGQFHGLEVNEVANYLSSIDLTTTAVNGITLTQLENGNYQARINIDTKIDTSSLNTMYIELSDLESYRDFIEGSGTAQLEKGNLMFYKEGNNSTATILIGEKDSLTNLSYNSILSVVELLYPNDLENFKTSYPSLETISFDRYTITTNPELTGTLETLYGQYQDEYQFVLIEIDRSL